MKRYLSLLLAVILCFGLVTVVFADEDPPVEPPAPSHEHIWSDWTTTKAATCTETGLETRTCSALDCPADTETRTIAALGHSYGTWTDNGNGTHSHSCTRSGCTEKETKNHSGSSYESEATNHWKK